MKKEMIMTAALALGLSACGTAETSTVSTDSGNAGLFTAGTYSVSAAGRNGDVNVTAVFTSDKIESIDIESEETESIGVTAMEQMKEEILENQSLAVDAVSGATLSSNAFMEALSDAVTQAGADPAALGYGEETSKVSDEVEYETEADIIVVGGGAAGMMAAVAASEEGASVILLEKSSVLGGNTVCAANGINAADSKVQLADETYQSKGASVEGLEGLQMNNEDARENLVNAFAENSGEVIDWFSDLGVEFTVNIQDDERNSEQNYYMLQAEEGGTTALTLVNYLIKAFNDSDVTVYMNMDAYELVDDNGTITGVIAKDADGNDVTFTGKAVMLATGGFGKNQELLAEVSPYLANATTDEVAPTTGEGLLMAEEAGADTVNLDAIQTFPHVIPDYGMILPMNLPGGFVPDALYVNNSAERFTAEGFEIPDAILSQDQGEVYCIFDDSGMNDSLQKLVDSGVISSAESAEELGEKLGIDGAKLSETITAFNEDIADGTDDAFGREQNLNSFEGTLYGYRFGVGAHYFMGGVLINEKTQVLDTDGNPINGLYAAGEVTGGFHGTFRVDGSGLGDSFTFGRISGKEMAEAVK